MTIDPTNVTNFNRSKSELEEFILFCIAVAGKNATTTSKNLEKLFCYGRSFFFGSPFEIIRQLARKEDLAELMRSIGFGCYNIKSRGFIEITQSGLDLKTCTVQDLEKIHGVGMKTARYFILHSRKNAGVACLDTHILRWLARHSGYDVPKQTPSRKKYLELERIFLKVAEALDIAPCDLDLKIWNSSRGSDGKSMARIIQKATC